MAVYTGKLSYNLSSTHKTGEKRDVVGVTDNKTFASIFGVFGRVGNTSPNGKIQMLEIGSLDSMKNTIYVDPNELQKVNEDTFLRAHIADIKMWSSVANYLEETVLSEMQSLLNSIQPQANYRILENSSRIALAKLYFDQMELDEVKSILQKQSINLAKNDTFFRTIIGVFKTDIIEYHGMELQATIKPFGSTKGLMIDDDKVTLTYKVDIDLSPSGSKSNIKGPGSKEAKYQFDALKNSAIEISKSLNGIKRNHTLNPRRSLEAQADNLKEFASEDTREIFKLLESRLQRITANDLRLDDLSDFNPATAIKHLWNELHFPSEIKFIGFDPSIANLDLKRYWKGEITAREFINLYSDVFLKQLKHDLSERFKLENIAIDNYTQAVIDRTIGDFPNVSRSDLTKAITNSINEVIIAYNEKILAISDISQMLSLYWSSNTAHNNTIIEEAEKRLRGDVGRFLSDKNKELKKRVKDFLQQHLSNLASQHWETYLEKFTLSTETDKKLKLDEKWVNVTLEEILNELFADNSLSRENYREQVVNWVTNIIEKDSRYNPENWFNKHYLPIKDDFEKNLFLENFLRESVINKSLIDHNAYNTENEQILSKINKVVPKILEIFEQKNKNESVDNIISNIFEYVTLFEKFMDWKEIEVKIYARINEFIRESLFQKSSYTPTDVIWNLIPNNIKNNIFKISETSMQEQILIVIDDYLAEKMNQVDLESVKKNFILRLTNEKSILNELAKEQLEEFAEIFFSKLREKNISSTDFKNFEEDLFKEFSESIHFDLISNVYKIVATKVRENFDRQIDDHTHQIISKFELDSTDFILKNTFKDLANLVDQEILKIKELKNSSKINKFKSDLIDKVNRILQNERGELLENVERVLSKKAHDYGITNISGINELERETIRQIETINDVIFEKISNIDPEFINTSFNISNKLSLDSKLIKSFFDANISTWIEGNLSVDWDVAKEQFEKNNSIFKIWANSLASSDFTEDAENLVNDYLKENGINDSVSNVNRKYVQKFYTDAITRIEKSIYSRVQKFLNNKNLWEKYSDPNKLMDYAIYDDETWKTEMLVENLDLEDLRYDLNEVVAEEISGEFPNLSNGAISWSLNMISNNEIFNISNEAAIKWVNNNLPVDYKEPDVNLKSINLEAYKREAEKASLELLIEYSENVVPRLTQDDMNSLDLKKRAQKFADNETSDILTSFGTEVHLDDFKYLLKLNISSTDMGQVYLPQTDIDNYWENLESSTTARLVKESPVDDPAFWRSIVHTNQSKASELYHDKILVSDFVEMFTENSDTVK